MNILIARFARLCVVLLLAHFGLASCATRPAEIKAPPVASVPGLERHYTELGGGISIEYQVERRISQNGVSCFAFFTGTLVNESTETLSRRTVLDFNVFNGEQQVFRDLTSPVADVAPGQKVMFGMVSSPVHRDGCMRYDRIVVSLRKSAAR